MNITLVMQTVKSILSDVYGSDAIAAERLGVGRSAVSNWKSWGHFPDRLLAQIVSDAKAADKDLSVDDVLSLRARATP